MSKIGRIISQDVLRPRGKIGRLVSADVLRRGDERGRESKSEAKSTEGEDGSDR